METSLEERLAEIREKVASSCRKSGRGPDAAEIIAVTKTHGPEAIRDAWRAGLHIMGENKVQEAAAKIPSCVSGPEWHLIGHLQKNKVRHALSLFSTIHSVDSAELLLAIDRIADEDGHSPKVLLEVNVSGESSKFGIRPDALPGIVETAMSCRRLSLEGFMTMAPFSTNPEDSRPHFARLRELRDDMERRFGASFPRLSMGMSGDYAVAAEEGATWLRIGTALFGAREKWRPAASGENSDETVKILD
ncbi:MAG: YggS family pyridoxal phosphate-dependent enzyme [Kiritimatiellae bacterium]|nr:YggS family pyridoxal phosphate-dependent enzyme [Kiritimatiellia bacterium]